MGYDLTPAEEKLARRQALEEMVEDGTYSSMDEALLAEQSGKQVEHRRGGLSPWTAGFLAIVALAAAGSQWNKIIGKGTTRSSAIPAREINSDVIHSKGDLDNIHEGIGSIAVGKEVCTVPWAVMNIDGHGIVLNDDYIFDMHGGGTFKMRVKRTQDGFEITTPQEISHSDSIQWIGATDNDLIPIDKVIYQQSSDCA